MGDANEALFGTGSGATAFKFANPGDTAVGVITHLDAIQSRVYGTNELEFWPSGDRKMIAIVTIATELRDPAVEDDDGQRAVWVRGKNMNEALRAAVKAAGAKRLEEGGQFFMRFTGLGKAEKGAQPPKLYEAGYRKPTPETVAQAAKYAVKTDDDPWAAVTNDEGFAPTPTAAQAAPAASGWPSEITPPAPTPQAVQQPLGAGNGASETVMVNGQTVDLSALPPEAAALVRKMAGAQA